LVSVWFYLIKHLNLSFFLPHLGLNKIVSL
jgi:hypothetical protein